VVSPDQMAEPLVTGAIFSIALVAIFLVMGGLRVAVDAIYESFQIWPMFQLIPEISEALYPIFIELLSKIFRVALALGAPIMIAMFLGEIALAYASRFAQQINVFDATLSAKNLIFLFIMPPYLYMLTAFYADDVLDIDGLVEIMGRMVAR
jgi:type III secretion protein T